MGKYYDYYVRKYGKPFRTPPYIPQNNPVAWYSQGNHTEFWRELSWRVGDEHANRICKLLVWYCKLFGLDANKFRSTPPRR